MDLSEVVVIRHTYTADGLVQGGVNPEALLAYTRVQGYGKGNKLGPNPPFLWLNFLTDGGRRSRFLTAYENHGELVNERTAVHRSFDLRPSEVLASLRDRLVVEWSGDAVNWAKKATTAAAFPIVEIADPVSVPFVGFENVLLSFPKLKEMVDDRRFSDWHSALSSVQGVYLIADTSTGHLYVGKADGGERILQRWSAYARDGHGGNKALKELNGLDPAHRQHFQFSILRVFDPTATTAEVDAAESHFKEALLTRKHGLNRN
ncbi:MAG: GIY-YIG nuclease family protein [Actinobacteria bacterium]|nr:GIY-YIG nuclease family protein [Actinomycetota bacterium]